MRLEVDASGINVQGHVDRLKAPAFWLFVGQQWQRLYTPYVPMDTGALSQTVQYNATNGEVDIEHVVPYAKHCYYGDKIRWRKTKHPLATSRWSEKAKPLQFPKLVSTVQAAIDGGKFEV